MLMTKTKMVVAGLCLIATSVCAQLPKVNVPTQRFAPAKISVEQLKEKLNTVKMHNPSLKMDKVNLSNKVMKPMTGIIPGTKRPMMANIWFGMWIHYRPAHATRWVWQLQKVKETPVVLW